MPPQALQAFVYLAVVIEVPAQPVVGPLAAGPGGDGLTAQVHGQNQVGLELGLAGGFQQLVHGDGESDPRLQAGAAVAGARERQRQRPGAPAQVLVQSVELVQGLEELIANLGLALRLQGLHESAGGLGAPLQAQTPGDASPDLGVAVGEHVVLQTETDAFVLDSRQQAQQDIDQVRPGGRGPGGIGGQQRLEGGQQRRHGAVGGQQQLLAGRFPLLGVFELLHQVVETRPAGRQAQGLQEDQGPPASLSSGESFAHWTTFFQIPVTLLHALIAIERRLRASSPAAARRQLV